MIFWDTVVKTLIVWNNFQLDSFRYHSLQEPMQIRRDNLEDALLLYQFSRDVEDELQWLFEKEPSATSFDYGSSLNSVQKLQKKHQVLSIIGNFSISDQLVFFTDGCFVYRSLRLSFSHTNQLSVLYLAVPNK